MSGPNKETGNAASMKKTLTMVFVLLFVGSLPFIAEGNEDLESVYRGSGSGNNAKLGWNVTRLKDIDGDGVDDYAVGAPGESRVYVFNGPWSSTYTIPTANWRISGPTLSNFGWDVNTLEDYNNDGRNEIIVGSPGESKAYIFTGRAKGTNYVLTQSNAAITINGGTGQMLGHSVAGIDYESNGEIFAIVGAPRHNHTIQELGTTEYRTGAVFLINISYAHDLGRTAVDPRVDRTFTGSMGERLVYSIFGYSDNGWFGFSVENLGDVNADGLEDMGIGDPYYSPTSTVTYPEIGSFYVQYGKSIQIEIPDKYPADLNGYIYGPANNSRFGWTIANLGDTIGGPGSGDELMVSAPFLGAGEVYLFYGGPGTIQKDLSQPNMFDENYSGEQDGDRFGWSMTRADIAGPTLPAVAIGAICYDNVTGTVKVDSGAVYAFWSTTVNNPATTAKAKFYGRSAGDNFAHSLSGVNFTRTAGEFMECILAAAPNAGSSNTGDIEALRRNQLPSLRDLTVSPPTGSMTTQFDLAINYRDLEGDLPEVIKVQLFTDNTEGHLLDEIPLARDPSDTNLIKDGVKYIARSTLPNSVVSSNPNAPLFMKVVANAVRGSKDTVTSSPKPIQGPIVDGIRPSATDNINWIKGASVPVEERVPGTFKISFEWPEENDHFDDNDETGKVKRLEIRHVMGNATLTGAGWGTYPLYREFIGANVKVFMTREELLMGSTDGSANPEMIVFPPGSYVSFAFRAEDEVGNVGNVSYSLAAQAYFRPLDIPDTSIGVDLQDYKGEDGTGDKGGALKVTFIPPSIEHLEDISVYWVYVEPLPFTSVSDLKANDSARLPDLTITSADDDGFYNHTAVVKTYKGSALEDGKIYYATVVAVNRWGQYTDRIFLSNNATVINDKEPSIPTIRDVNAVSLNGQGKIKITWTPTTLPRFVSYTVYGQSYFFDNIDQANRLGEIRTASVSELTISEIAGVPIHQRSLYSFAVVALDYNNHVNLSLDENNTVHGVHYIAPDDVWPPNPDGFTVRDVPADKGGVLTLSWFPLVLDEFWQYKVYFSDRPITDLSEMEPIAVIGNIRVGDLDVMEFKGAPLMDGMLYYAVITTVDWNLEENLTISLGNYDWDEPVNQSDRAAPNVIPAGLAVVEGSITLTSFKLTWITIQPAQVLDFDHYLVRYVSAGKSGEFVQERIDNGSASIDGLSKGTIYNVNISIVDDNDNIGPASPYIDVETAGRNQPPVVTGIALQVEDSTFYMNDTDSSFEIKSTDIKGEIYLTVAVEDDYTKSTTKFIYEWNITPPKGVSFEKNNYQFPLEIPKDVEGKYLIRVRVRDEGGLWSHQFNLTIEVKKVEESTVDPTPYILGAFAIIVLASIGVVLYVLRSGKSSQQKEMVEQYEGRRKDIETMEVIYTDLPTWTCSCGTTRVQVIENANCPSCFESHEAVPIDQVDQYLRDHDLVLKEMRIDVPPAWQGQDMAKDRAKKDLEDRKKRSLEALNEEFAMFLKGTKYESEVKPPVEGEGVPEQPSQKTSLYHEGAIIPGQAPPPGPQPPQIGQHPLVMGIPMMPQRPGIPPVMPPGHPMQGRPPVIIPQPQRPPQQPQK